MTTTVQKWGNSLALRIPRAVAQQIRIESGDAVEVTIKSGTLTIRAARPRYRLADLVKSMDKGNRHTEVEWGHSVGREA